MDNSEFKNALLEKASEVSGLNINHLELAMSVNEAMEIFMASVHVLIEKLTGFSRNYFKVLRMLYVYAPEGVALSKIAEHVGITRASMTQIINNLEKRALIERVENPKDKRSSLVLLTPEGIEVVRVIFAKYHLAISELACNRGAKEMQNTADIFINMSKRLNNI